MQTSEAEDLQKLYKSDNFLLRGRYDRTIQTILSVFPRDEIFFGFYETLFNAACIAELCRFLGLDYVEPDFGVQKNVSPKQVDISEDLKAEVARFYAPSYHAAAQVLSEEVVQAAWPSAKAVFDA